MDARACNHRLSLFPSPQLFEAVSGMSVIHKSSMQGHTATVTINASPTPSPHSIDYGQTAITTGRISTYELPSEDSIPEEESEETTDVSKIAMQYYTTVEPSSVGSSHDSTSTASPGSDSVASGHALHVAVLQSSGSDHPSVCIPASGSQSDSGSSTVKHWTYEEQFKQVKGGARVDSCIINLHSVHE